MRRSHLLSLPATLALCLATTSLPAAPAKPAPKRITVGPNVVLEIDGAKRRVIVASKVCLRMGPLEGLLTRTKKKEHEYILAADIDARILHTALEAAGAKAGSPVELAPVYRPARGTPIRVTLRFQKGGKTITVNAREWVRHAANRKDLDRDWVFAGSRFVASADDPQRRDYIANHGDVVCTCNMESALLDLPLRSPKKFDARLFEAHTDRIPEVSTAVEVIFEPLVEKGGR
jgi:hypothetical protein